MAIVRQGEWSGWLPADFPLLPHIALGPRYVSRVCEATAPAVRSCMCRRSTSIRRNRRCPSRLPVLMRAKWLAMWEGGRRWAFRKILRRCVRACSTYPSSCPKAISSSTMSASSGRFAAALHGRAAVLLFLVGGSEFPCAVGQARRGVTGYISRGGSIHRRSHAPRTGCRADGDVGPWVRRVRPRRQSEYMAGFAGPRSKAYALGLNGLYLGQAGASRKCGSNFSTFATRKTDRP
jgi:hypothetical protein